MSIVTYNGVTLPYSNMTSFTQEAMYDKSDTDWFCTKFTIGITTIINTVYINTIAPDLATTVTDPVTLMNKIRVRLLQNRRALSYLVNGVDLIPPAQSTGEFLGLAADPQAGTVDAQNGPHPVKCDIKQMMNTTFVLDYQITAQYWENNLEASASLGQFKSPGNAVLYNRWTETIDMDEFMYTTRTRSGRYMIRSDNTQGLLADQVRNSMAVIAVPNGFKRISSKYVIDPSGLGIEYTLVDKEQFKMPPVPAFKAEGTYKETTMLGDGQRFGETNITLWGAKNTTQSELINAAITVGTAKSWGIVVDNSGPNPVVLVDPVAINMESSILVHLYENKVEYHTKVRYHYTNSRVGSTTLTTPIGQSVNTVAPSQRLQYTPGSDDITELQLAPPYLARGTANLLLRAASYYDPTLGASIGLANDVPFDNPETRHGSRSVQMVPGLEPGTAGKTKE